MAGAILVGTLPQAGEELGWRGFALPRLARYAGLGSAGLLIGIVWALRHLPLSFLPGTGMEGQSFPLYLLHVTAVSVALTWLYWKTGGSLLLVILMHASINNTTEILPAAVPGATNAWVLHGAPVAWITVALSWAVAAWCLVQLRGSSVTAPRATPGCSRTVSRW